MPDIKQQIRDIAFGCGFSHVGFAKAEPLRAEASRLEEWLTAGYHAAMGWMARNEEWRTDPTVYFPGAKTIISFTLNYYTPFHHSGSPETGNISRYAWGDDYHDLMGEKMAAMISETLKVVPEANLKATCDTAPVMDKVWAQRAGIGWIGKHTNVITKDIGSWVFIGEIFTDLEIEPDTLHADFCGNCTKCIDACPTDAITQPYVLDSRKCISYLSIEHKNEFWETTPPFDGWLYGCDICQDVCPWNSKAMDTTEPEFYPRLGAVDMPLAEAQNITDEEFKSRFKGSPVLRTKAYGLRRNAVHNLEHSRAKR